MFSSFGKYLFRVLFPVFNWGICLGFVVVFLPFLSCYGIVKVPHIFQILTLYQLCGSWPNTPVSAQ